MGLGTVGVDTTTDLGTTGLSTTDLGTTDLGATDLGTTGFGMTRFGGLTFGRTMSFGAGSGFATLDGGRFGRAGRLFGLGGSGRGLAEVDGSSTGLGRGLLLGVTMV